MPADLASLLRARGLRDVDDSALARSLYASDASLYRIEPAAVVCPRDEDELLAVLTVANAEGVPVTMRGAGTSIAGNAIGPGIVLDTSKHFNQVLAIDPDERTATVRPGIVHAALQRAAAPHGLRFGPDPSTHTRCTIGGMIGNNACGSRALGYGKTSDNMVSLRAVDVRGETLTADRLTGLVDADLALIRTEFGRFSRQVSGYAFAELLPENQRRLDRFLVGSEGTLAVVLQAEMRLVRDAPHRALAVLGFGSMADAADAVPALLAHPLIACEGLDARITDLVANRPELPPGSGWLLAEVAAETEAEAASLAAAVVATAGVPHRVVTDPAEQAALWRIREDGAGLAARTLPRQAQSGWEDAAVPPARLGDYLRDFEALLDGSGLGGVPYGHFGDGCVHVRIDFDLDSDPGRVRMREFLEQAASLVGRYGGSMSGEHGDGRARSELLPKMYSADAIALMARAKALLDPDNLLNPGVLVDPDPLDAHIRRAEPARAIRPLLAFAHDDGSFHEAVHRCTGVGKCRANNTGPGGVMCPSYTATLAEKDSTRGRARVLQDVATGALPVSDPAVSEALDLCLSCKGCASDCPTGIDMASYKSEILHQQFARRPWARPRSHWMLGQLPRLARLTPPKLANRMLRSKTLARVAKSLAGVDQRRSLPSFSEQPWASTSAPSGGGEVDVYLWADSFTDRFAAGIGRTAVDYLASLGLRVGVIDEQACCGLTWITTGQLGAARRIVGQAVSTLHPYVAAGVPVVGLEPSCLAAIRSDAEELAATGSERRRAAEVAAGMQTLAEFLTDLPDWRGPDLTGVEILAQPHCHHASVLGWSADENLLRSLGASLTRVGGCCGLAGNFGVEQGHYEVSVAVAEHDLLPAVRANPDAVVLADGFSCRTQLADLAPATAPLHLVELLARKH